MARARYPLFLLALLALLSGIWAGLIRIGWNIPLVRPASPTLVYPCDFLNFSTSRSTLDLAGRKMIHELENGASRHLEDYAAAGSRRNLAMVERIRRNLRLTSLKFQRLDDLVAAIGLPKSQLCTHCWDGSSHF